MSKFLTSFILLSFITTNLIIAQCSGIVSPEPTCIRVLPNGDVEVDYDIASMGGSVPAEISEFKLQRSPTGTVWTDVSVISVGTAWPNPQTFNDIGANGCTTDWIYRIVAICVGPPLTQLPPSSVIKPIRLKYIVSNNKEVNLFWNWDSLSTNLNPVTVNRKQPYTAANWIGIANPSFKMSAMSYTDTVITTNIDTLNYRIVLNNTSALCQSISCENLVVISIYSSVEKNNDTWSDKLNIFPNPSKGTVFIEFPDIDFEKKLEIVDSEGKILSEELLPAQSTKYTTNIPSSGIYFIKVIINDDHISKKIIINRE